MTTILFVVSSNENDNELKEVLRELDCSLLTCTTRDKITDFTNNHVVSLVIWEIDSPDQKLNTVGLSAADSMPLLLAEGHTTETKVFEKPDPFITIDHLRPPYTIETVSQKLTHLAQVRRIHSDLLQARTIINELEQRITELNTSLDGHNEFLDLISKRDGLTGLHNRRHFNKLCRDFFTGAVNGDSELSLVLFNIDYFSEINRKCGQDFGDFVLNELAARLTSLSREKDFCFRLSGEEFAILMPATDAEGAQQIAERLRTTCETKVFDNNIHSRKVTISVGISSLQKNGAHSHEELINMADQALFLAKSEGRNRTIFYEPIDKASLGKSEKNFSILQDTMSRILGKTKLATLRSLQLLAQEVIDEKENERIRQTQELSELLGKRLGFTSTLIETFKNASILLISIRSLLHHDMISQNRTLNGEEWDILTDFPYEVTQLIEIFEYFSSEKTLLRYHCERYDGSGYPEGLRAEQIPMGARVFHLVNSFTAMLSDRPYRKKLSPEQALKELATNAGGQFDPLLAMKLIDVIEETGILGNDIENIEKTRRIIQDSYSR